MLLSPGWEKRRLVFGQTYVRLTRMNVEAPLEKLSKVFGGFSGPRGDVIGLHVNSHFASRSSPDVPPRRFLVIGDRQRRLNHDSGVPVDLPALNHQIRLKYQAVPYLRRRKLAVQKRLLQVPTANFQIRERLGRNMNQLNFLGSFSIVKALTDDDNSKFYKVDIGQVFQDRYRVETHLGAGRYASVWLVIDTQTGEHAALKILNSDFYNGHHQIFELEVMQKVTAVSNQSQHPGKNHVTYLKNHFDLEGPTGKHVCMVMPLLGDSIAEKATTGHIIRIPPQTVRNIAKQILLALDFLHRECGVIHTDLQPSNILNDDQGQTPKEIDELVRTQSSGPEFNDPNMQFRLNDLGIACFVDQHLTDDIQSEYLRAPEITLEAPWDPSVDIFSLGCLLFQFITGDLPFVGRPGPGVTADQDRIATLVSTFGPIPNVVLDNAAQRQEFEQQSVNGLGFPISLETMVGQSFAGDTQGMMPIDELELFCDFLRKMLASDPREREHADALYRHAWLAYEG
ncbi:serine protein kinase Sky1 [Aureobasidium pullulans]|nr:serine protein kinase Sky1 [Aureobasidium pullulans]